MSFASTPSGTATTLTSVFGALFLPKNVPQKTPLSKRLFTNLQLPFYRGKKVLNLFKNRILSSQPARSNGKLLPVHQTGSTPTSIKPPVLCDLLVSSRNQISAWASREITDDGRF